MKDTNIGQRSKEKSSDTIKNLEQNKSNQSLQENSISTNNINHKNLIKAGNESKQVKSKFINRSELSKDKEICDNKSVKEDNCNKYIQFNSDKKIRQNSVFQDLIVKIIELNNTESSNNSNVLFIQKEDTVSISNSTLKPKKLNAQSLPQIKNKNTVSKNKNNVNSISKSGSQSGSQDARKHSNIKSDSSNSFIPHHSENEYKYSSFTNDQLKIHLKKTDNFLGFTQISGNSDSNQQLTFRVPTQNNIANVQLTQRSNIKNNNNKEIKYDISKRQKEIAQSIMELDLNKLKKEVYEYENTDITDAINRLPTHKIDSDNNNNKTSHIKKKFKIKNNKRKKSKKYIKNIKERFRILRRVGYVYDSLDDEEYEDEEDNNFYFEPNGNFILILDFLILVSSLFYLVFLPIHLAISPFNENNLGKDFVFYFIDIIFIIDFVSGFFRAYFNFDEDLIKNSVSIIQNYLKTWFSLDFLCSIPVFSMLEVLSLKNKFQNNNCYENCSFNFNGKNLYHLFEMLKLLKLIKTFNNNVAKNKIKLKFNKINFFYNWGHVIKQAIRFITILNLSSCLFIFSARSSYPNWILNTNMNTHNFISIYVCSCYYIITTITTVGYGDIVIYSMIEKIFGILFLIIGTCLYSWILTSTSNYIKKLNEKNLEFEQKKEILDDIKSNYPLMSHDLYNKIYKLLYYKKTHKEVDKNIIIDSLPYSIKNNLLIQMYYPIITNFKFFKYFRNSEFVIEIVSVLRPLVGMKGDLLINEGDYVEDIIFNKSGILSLEIYIDLNNPDEFIKEYLIKYNLDKSKNKENLESNNEINSTSRKNSFNSSFFSKSSLNLNKMYNSTIKSSNANFSMSIKHEKYNLGKEKTTKRKFKYLKIINIREKEHFGDVLMFLNEPSPLNVRVNSKVAEVLLLNKTDAVKISSNFPNIWKKMNESSIFNLEQIKNFIMQKLSIFCFSNGIKIRSLSYKKDTKTGQNKTQYSLIPIPNPNRENILNLNNNLNENNDKYSKDNDINSSQSFQNSNEKDTIIIKEVQSSEENRTNTKSISAKEYKNSNENCKMSKKGPFKKMSDNINISNKEEYSINKNINNKRDNKYSEKNIIENQNKSFTHSKSTRSFCPKKKSSLSNKNKKHSTKTNRTKTFTNVNNIISKNISSKSSRNSLLSNSHTMNSFFNTSAAIPFPKVIKKYQNFDEKSKMNKKLISLPSFSFMKNYNNNSINCELDDINDEIHPNENFEIKIPDNEHNLIINNNIESQDNSISNPLESPTSFDKKNSSLNNIKKEYNNIDVSNNLNSNNKFTNLKIFSMSSFEIKSSYDNINEITNYRFISNDLLIKKTKIFLNKECNLLYDTSTNFSNTPHHTPSHNRSKFFNSLKNKKSFENDNNINNLSIMNDNDTNISTPFSKELKKIGFIKTKKNSEKILQKSLKEVRILNNSFDYIKKNINIKGENEFDKKGDMTCKHMFNKFSPKKEKIKADRDSDSIISIKTKHKLDLITKNMNRDNQNLNNPNEFYADLFNNIYKKKIKKKESVLSMPKIKIKKNIREGDSSEEKEKDKDKENSFNGK